MSKHLHNPMLIEAVERRELEVHEFVTEHAMRRTRWWRRWGRGDVTRAEPGREEIAVESAPGRAWFAFRRSS